MSGDVDGSRATWHPVPSATEQAGPTKVTVALVGRFPAETTGPELVPGRTRGERQPETHPVGETSFQRPRIAITETLQIFGRQQGSRTVSTVADDAARRIGLHAFDPKFEQTARHMHGMLDVATTPFGIFPDVENQPAAPLRGSRSSVVGGSYFRHPSPHAFQQTPKPESLRRQMIEFRRQARCFGRDRRRSGRKRSRAGPARCRSVARCDHDVGKAMLRLGERLQWSGRARGMGAVPPIAEQRETVASGSCRRANGTQAVAGAPMRSSTDSVSALMSANSQVER